MAKGSEPPSIQLLERSAATAACARGWTRRFSEHSARCGVIPPAPRSPRPSPLPPPRRRLFLSHLIGVTVHEFPGTALLSENLCCPESSPTALALAADGRKWPEALPAGEPGSPTMARHESAARQAGFVRALSRLSADRRESTAEPGRRGWADPAVRWRARLRAGRRTAARPSARLPDAAPAAWFRFQGARSGLAAG